MRTIYEFAIALLVFIIIVFSFSSYAQSQVKWYSFTTGLGLSNSGVSVVTSSVGESFIGTSSNENIKIISGFLVFSSSTVTDVSSEKKITPAVYKLYQNYPNPFNPSTIIGWQLPVGSHVSLKVYDILGREVAILVNEEKPAGVYKFSFNADNLASGVYFYILKSDNYTSVKKMILLH